MCVFSHLSFNESVFSDIIKQCLITTVICRVNITMPRSHTMHFNENHKNKLYKIIIRS